MKTTLNKSKCHVIHPIQTLHWIIVCCVVLYIAPTQIINGADIYVDYNSNGNETASVLEHFHDLYDQQYTIDSELLRLNIRKRKLYFTLRQGNANSALQALCQSLGDDIWWYSDNASNIIITKKNVIPLEQNYTSISYSSTVEKPTRYHRAISDILSPWCNDLTHTISTNTNKGGFSILEAEQRIIANLSAEGHSDLARILTVIENGVSQIPPRSLQQPPHVLPLMTAINGDNWTTCLNALANTIQCSISISQSLLYKKQNITITSCLIKDLIPQLRSYGVHAAWVAGVLCCDLSPISERQHAASNRHIIGVSLQQFSDTKKQQQIVERLQRQIMPAYWKRAGCALVYIRERQVLLVAAHNSAISAIMLELRRLDRLPE